ncbi:MAG: hypothetical protein EBZ77_15220, partial [Chitinophagia bacterium]|nr:hypothetical protein [Chitinophagia bacterium]
AQIPVVPATSVVQVKTPYTADADVQDLTTNVQYSQLVGDTLCFAPAGSGLFTPPIVWQPGNTVVARYRTVIASQLQQAIHQLQGHGATRWTISTPSVLPASQWYQPGTAYSTTCYQPQVLANATSHTLTVVTPYSALSGRSFVVLRCSDSAVTGPYSFLNWLLLDDRGDTLMWTIHTRDLWKCPAHLKGYLSRLQATEVGKVYYVSPNSHPQQVLNTLTNSSYTLHAGQRFRVREVRWVAYLQSPCAQPFIFFEDSSGSLLAVAPTTGKAYPAQVPAGRRCTPCS